MVVFLAFVLQSILALSSRFPLFSTVIISFYFDFRHYQPGLNRLQRVFMFEKWQRTAERHN